MLASRSWPSVVVFLTIHSVVRAVPANGTDVSLFCCFVEPWFASLLPAEGFVLMIGDSTIRMPAHESCQEQGTIQRTMTNSSAEGAAGAHLAEEHDLKHPFEGGYRRFLPCDSQMWAKVGDSREAKYRAAVLFAEPRGPVAFPDILSFVLERIGVGNMKKVSAVVTNLALLHRLHIAPYRNSWPAAMGIILNLESALQDALHAVQNSAIFEGPQKRPHLVVNTPHYICVSRFVPPWSEALSDVSSRRSTITTCTKDLEDKVRNDREHSFSGAEIQDFCEKALFTNESTWQLSQRIKAWARQHPRDVTVMDAFEITRDQCWATRLGDGRHYVPLVPVELREILVAIFNGHVKAP